MTVSSSSRLLAIAAALVGALLWASPAQAAPDNVKVSNVFELPCAGSICDAGEDQALSEGAVVNGSLQIHVSARSTLGLDWVELQARQVLTETGSWVCMKHWSSPGSNVSREFNWDTDRWPGDSGDAPAGCEASSYHGDLTRNAQYDFRVQARDASGTTTSSVFSVKVSNAAQTPEWVDEPSVEGADERSPMVTLRWRATPEPDVREYHFIREGRDGEQEYAVSATKPGGQGCELDGDVYTCYDNDFSSEGFGGSYSYTVVAMRASPSSRQSCSLPPYGDCVESERSDSRSLGIAEPPPPGPDATDPTPTEKPTAGRGGSGGGGREPSQVNRSSSTRGSFGSGGSAAEFFQGEYERELPYDSPGGFDLPGGEGRTPVAIGPDGEPIFVTDTSGRLRAMKVLALGLILLLISGHLARLLREPRDAI